MNAQLSLFPVVDAPLFRRLGFEAEPYTFYYMFEGEVRQLDVESAADGQTFKLLDPLGNVLSASGRLFGNRQRTHDWQQQAPEHGENADDHGGLPGEE